MSDDVCAELKYAKECIERGDYDVALVAIDAAIKAWDVEVNAWAQELAAAEKEIREPMSEPLGIEPDTYTQRG